MQWTLVSKLWLLNVLWSTEIPLPNEQARLDILKIHAAPITKHGELDYEGVVKLAEDFNGADLRLKQVHLYYTMCEVYDY